MRPRTSQKRLGTAILIFVGAALWFHRFKHANKQSMPHFLNTSNVFISFGIKYDQQHSIEVMFSQWRQRFKNYSLLTVPPEGRLGNQMFQYASLLGIAFRNRKRPFVSQNGSGLLDLFMISFHEDIDFSPWELIREDKHAAFDPQMDHLPEGDLKMVSFFQSWRYFHDIETKIREEFRFRKDYHDLGLATLKKYTSSFINRTTIALHVRRSDMTSKIEIRRGHTVAPLSYIVNAVSYMKSKFSNCVFLIATDDPEWCRQLQKPDMIIMENANAYMDFVALVMCDHMIMTVGTFGWWAAWLNGGHVVYYSDYPRTGTEVAAEFDKADYFVPHWVPLH